MTDHHLPSFVAALSSDTDPYAVFLDGQCTFRAPGDFALSDALAPLHVSFVFALHSEDAKYATTSHAPHESFLACLLAHQITHSLESNQRLFKEAAWLGLTFDQLSDLVESTRARRITPVYVSAQGDYSLVYEAPEQSPTGFAIIDSSYASSLFGKSPAAARVGHGLELLKAHRNGALAWLQVMQSVRAGSGRVTQNFYLRLQPAQSGGVSE